MKKLIFIIAILGILSSCSTSKKCDGGRKIKTEMW